MDSLLDNKTFYLNDYVKIDFEGDKEAVKKLLQGQITSDIEESGSTFFQPSAICDVKGFVIADFLILNAEEMISVIIHNSLAACLKAELEPMLPFYKTSLKETKVCCLGFIGNKKTIGMPISFLQTKAEVSLKIDHQEEKNSEHLNFSEWKLANYLNGNIFLSDNSSKKYRPHELGFDKSQISASTHTSPRGFSKSDFAFRFSSLTLIGVGLGKGMRVFRNCRDCSDLTLSVQYGAY